MRVVVGIPWRPKEGRFLAYCMVREFYKRHLPDALVVEVDTPHEEYNLAAARNKVVVEAAKLDADIVIISDADCIIAPPSHLDDAIVEAFEDGRVHMPFMNQMYLSEAETAGLAVHRTEPVLGGHLGNGCCYVMRPDTYERFGGSDERFSGWGGDDDQLVAAATCLVGLVRHPGVSLSLWHPAVRDVGSGRHRPNSELARRYWAAIGNKSAMRAVIAERNY